MLRLITDFDGPIMDVSDRYYSVYRICLEKNKHPDLEIKQLSKSEFWQLKRSQTPETKIGMISGLDRDRAEKFAKMRRQTVHQLEQLEKDRPLPNAIETLEKIKKLGFDLVVMTMRRERELKAALDRYDLHKYFKSDRRYFLANEYVKTGDVKDKPLLMARALKELPPVKDIWMVGDTEADIIAAKTHNIKVIGVLSGIRDLNNLQVHQPDYIVNDFDSALKLIREKTTIDSF